MAAKKPASKVSPFAAMTLGDQDTRWLSLHSQLLPYMTAVPAKDAKAPGSKFEPNASLRTNAQAFGQIPVFNSPPQPPKHDQYDAVHKKMDEARRNTMNWQEIQVNN